MCNMSGKELFIHDRSLVILPDLLRGRLGVELPNLWLSYRLLGVLNGWTRHWEMTRTPCCVTDERMEVLSGIPIYY